MTDPEMNSEPLLSARGISKQFGGVEVLIDVDLDLMPGEIHALIGENGAGKSTFAKIVAGVHRPTRGSLTFNGRAVDVANPIVAQRLGITLIHQEPISFPDLSVAENLVLGRHEGAPLAPVPWTQMTRDARKLMICWASRSRSPGRCEACRSPTNKWSRSRALSPRTAG